MADLVTSSDVLVIEASLCNQEQPSFPLQLWQLLPLGMCIISYLSTTVIKHHGQKKKQLGGERVYFACKVPGRRVRHGGDQWQWWATGRQEQEAQSLHLQL